jgi:peptidoglycan/LPS O-acetylase OafA/YrhL
VSPNRIHSVDLLRGIASLAVCYLHLTFSLPAGFLHSSGTYGALGVQVFFVISGFIIPYALARANFKLRDYGTFVFKRMLRLDPPYLVVIALIIPLGYLCAHVPGFNGPPYHVSITQVLLHFAYLNAFFNQEWLNPVFWTLAIEFQYYLLVGLLFPLIAYRKRLVRYLLLAGLGGVAILFPGESYKPYLPHWLFLFMLGIVTFHKFAGLVGKWEYWGWAVLLTGGCAYTLGWAEAAVGFSTACVILYLHGSNQAVLFFGNISYSLYLIHIPIGVKIVNLGIRWAKGWESQLLLLVIALGVSIGSAYVLYRLIEKPAQQWSSAIKYRKPSAAGQV